MKYILINQLGKEMDQEWITPTFGLEFKGEILNVEDTIAVFKDVWDTAIQAHILAETQGKDADDYFETYKNSL